MSVFRITEFRAQAGKLPELTRLFQSIIPKILVAEGCQGCDLLLFADGQDKLLVKEKWSDISFHQAAADRVDQADFNAIMEILDGLPQGKYYTEMS